MGVRPTDWNAIGLSADPTPGDPARINELITSMTALGTVARDIDDALKAVLDTTGNGGFVGKTADALRKRISGPLRAFVQSIAEGFENAVKALRTYADLMPTHQSAADGALTSGRGLAADDPKRAECAATATAAGTAQRTQAEDAARAVNAAANGIRQPVTDCALFWEAFNILAIILIVPALILGGPLALIAIGVNLAIFIKTAVDFARGKAGILDLFLSGLGMIAPTTKGINVLKLLKDGSKFLWKGIKEFGRGTFDLLKRAFTMGGLRSFAFIPGLKDFARFAGGWVKAGGLWVGAAVLHFPSWAAGMISKGGLLVVKGIKAIPALFRAIPGALKGFAGATWKFAKNELGNGKWLRLILPVDAAEIGKYGLKGALKIGFYERGVLGKFRYGAPLVSAGGRGLAQIPTPPLRGLDALTDMPIGDLAKIRVGDWAGGGPGNLRLGDLPTNTNLAPGSPSGLHIPTSFGEAMHFAPDAVRKMDALLDLPIHELGSIQIGDWAKLAAPAGTLRLDNVAGLGAIGHLTPSGNPATALQGLPTTSIAHVSPVGAPATTLHALPSTTMPGVVATPHTSSLAALDLVQPAMTHRPNTPTVVGGGPVHGSAQLPSHGLAMPHVDLRPVELGAPSTGAGVAPAALASGPPPTALAHERVGSALNLLDNGPTSVHVVDSPANAGALPTAPAATTGGALTPAPLPTNTLSVAPTPPPPPSPPGHGLTGPGDRLTPTQITQLWQRDADRVGAVFGAADDPQRAVRIDAWGNLASARNELGKAQQLLHDAQAHPGGPSRGPSPESVAQQAVDRAEIKVKTALAHVDDLGMNVGHIDAGLAQASAQSLLEHPRLIGGSSHGASGSGAVGSAPNTPLVTTAVTPPPPPMPDIALHGNGGTWLGSGSVRPTVDGNGAVHYQVLGADGTPEPGAHVTLRGDGSFDVEHADGRGYGFDSTGGLVDESFPLHGAPGTPSSFTLLTEHHPGGPPTHTLAGGTGNETLDVLGAAGYRVTDARTGVSTRFDLHGNFAGRDVALIDAAGNRGHYVVSTGGGHTLTDLHGNTLTHLELSAPGEGLLRLTDDATGASTLHGADGHIIETSTSLVDDLGARGTLFVVERDGTHMLTDAAGQALTGTRQLDLPPGAGPRVTDTATGASVRYDLAGRPIERGTGLAGPGGVRGDRFVVADGAGHVVTDAAGRRLGDVVQVTPEGGYRIEPPPGGARTYERFDVDGNATGRGRQLFDEAGNPAGMLDIPAPVGPHPLASGPGAQLFDDALTPGSARPVTEYGPGGIRVEDPDGGHRMFDAASGRLTDQSIPLRGPDGAPGGTHVTIHHEPGVQPRFTAVDGNGAALPNVTVTSEHGIHQLTDAGNHNSFVRYGADGRQVETGTALHGPGGADGTFAVVRESHGGGAPVWHLENADGPVPHRTVTRDANNNLRVVVDHPNTPRHGEFRDYGPEANLRHEGFNALKDGRRTDHQFLVDHTTPTPSWRQGFHPDVTPPTGTRPSPTGFQHGTVDLSGAANGRIRLQSATKGKVDVFERRLLPDGTTLDAFRRTDLTGFGSNSRRTTWVQWDHGGVAVNSGTRRFDTSGFGWQDVNGHGVVVRESRESIQKFGGTTGHTIGIKSDRTWAWHRYDGAGHELASGPRTMHNDGGWSDRLTPGGDLVQKQWGAVHTPDKARHYFEHTVSDAGVRQPSWAKQSPQGKESGKHTVDAAGSTFTVERLSEQRPPQWVRKRWIQGAAEPAGAHGYLGADTRYQLFAWQQDIGGVRTGGARFVGDDGSWVDILADGTFARSETKLHGGGTLKVGDTARPPANVPAELAHADARAWSDGTTSGFRVETPNGPGGAVWQDRRWVPAGANGAPGHWEVVREGFPNGSIREHAAPPHVNVVNGDIPGRHGATWIQRDGHGYPVGHAQRWPDGAGGTVRIVAEGGPNAKSWQWQAIDGQGNVTAHGRRDLFRGSNDPRLPFDDSFRDFDQAGNLVRDKRMLDGGSYVDSWHVADPTPGGAGTWEWRKYGRNGAEQTHGGSQAARGEQTRTWWNPDGGTGSGAWERTPTGNTSKDLLFRDEFRVPGSPHSTVVRETPPHLAGSAPDRIRQYHPGTDQAPAAGTWTEFDHGTAVRTRTTSGTGFLEHDAWRGQWRKYDADDNLIARRTDSGLVFERDSLSRWRATGTEYDFRGPLTELRGWGRRLREGQRMPWTGSELGIDVTRFRAALVNLPGVDTTGSGVLRLGEAGYQPYWQVVAKKAALEFAQEFAIEFAANLLANGINAAINNKQFTWADVGKAAANAAVGSAVKTTVGTFVHENKFDSMRWTGDRKAGLGNIDGGKHPNRRPNNHDKTWANEWAGNETPTRWRSGTYDFFVGGGIGALAGWVNGSMNAAVWGVKDANGVTQKLTGWEALADGGISALSGTLSAGSVALARNLVMTGAGGRFFHRQGFADFLLNIGFKTGEKLFNSWLQSALRGNFNPFWY